MATTGFAAQMEGISAALVAQANDTFRIAIKNLGQRMLDRSPIDTGQFKSNWRYGLQTPDRFTNATTTVRTVNNLEELPKVVLGFVHYVTNALPYGPALEAGHSRQAPQGFVKLTAMEWERIVADAAQLASARSYIASAVPYAKV